MILRILRSSRWILCMQSAIVPHLLVWMHNVKFTSLLILSPPSFSFFRFLFSIIISFFSSPLASPLSLSVPFSCHFHVDNICKTAENVLGIFSCISLTYTYELLSLIGFLCIVCQVSGSVTLFTIHSSIFSVGVSRKLDVLLLPSNTLKIKSQRTFIRYILFNNIPNPGNHIFNIVYAGYSMKIESNGCINIVENALWADRMEH